MSGEAPPQARAAWVRVASTPAAPFQVLQGSLRGTSHSGAGHSAARHGVMVRCRWAMPSSSSRSIVSGRYGGSAARGAGAGAGRWGGRALAPFRPDSQARACGRVHRAPGSARVSPAISSPNGASAGCERAISGSESADASSGGAGCGFAVMGGQRSLGSSADHGA
ncbi:hypothetical protein ADK51_10735 [Streptomyces sp. WM6368]|nr:hypothetical protein ADK51_10735 [Streptomyces sp. WM6368]